MISSLPPATRAYGVSKTGVPATRQPAMRFAANDVEPQPQGRTLLEKAAILKRAVDRTHPMARVAYYSLPALPLILVNPVAAILAVSVLGSIGVCNGTIADMDDKQSWLPDFSDLK